MSPYRATPPPISIPLTWRDRLRRLRLLPFLLFLFPTATYFLGNFLGNKAGRTTTHSEQPLPPPHQESVVLTCPPSAPHMSNVVTPNGIREVSCSP